MINAVKNGEGNFGYNAATSEYGDMLEMGILDPAKVTRSALEHAASVAGLMLTTECMITDVPEDKPALPDLVAPSSPFKSCIHAGLKCHACSKPKLALS